VQKISQNFFDLFGIPESFTVDLELIGEKYRDLQTKVHPDRFADAGEQEKLAAVQYSSYLNDAFGTLVSPIKRAAYMLVLHDLDIEHFDQSELSMDLLLEQMRLREALDGLSKEESQLAELSELKAEVAKKFQQSQLSFASYVDKGELPAAKQTFHEMQFLNKLLTEIETKEEQRLGY